MAIVGAEIDILDTFNPPQKGAIPFPSSQNQEISLPSTVIPADEITQLALQSLVSKGTLVDMPRLILTLTQVKGSLAQQFFEAIGISQEELSMRLSLEQDVHPLINPIDIHVSGVVQNAAERAKRQGQSAFGVNDIFAATADSQRAFVFYERLGLSPVPKRVLAERRLEYYPSIGEQIRAFCQSDGKDLSIIQPTVTPIPNLRPKPAV